MDFIAETAVWRTRHGANLYQAYPYALAALDSLDRHLPRMAAYAERAREVALALSGADGITVAPLPPHTNAFQVHLPGDAQTIEEGAGDRQGARRGVWLFNWLATSLIPGNCMGEILVGDAAERLPTEEIVGLLARLAR